LATAAATVAGVMSGCGGSTSGGSSNDSGVADVSTVDHVEAAVMEAGPEAASEASMDAACVNDVMITSIPIPDGSVPGTDASTAVCLGCVETACPMLISECNATCGCPEDFIMFESCINGGGAITTCGASLLNALPLSDLTCAFGCASACGVSLEGGAQDGGDGGGNGEGGGDGASDATGQ
jgi:hypothetical protein